MSNVDSWCKACGEVDLPSELQDLEDGIHHHQGLYEHITATYSEVASRLDFICYNLKTHKMTVFRPIDGFFIVTSRFV